MYFLLVSVGQKCRHSWAGSSAQGHAGCHHGLPGAGFSSGGSTGEGSTLPAHMVAGSIQFLKAREFTAACLFKPSKERQQASGASLLAGQSLMCHHAIIEMTCHHHCHILWEASHRSCLNSRGRNYTWPWTPRGRPRSYLKNLPTTVTDHSGKYLKDDQEVISMDTAHGCRTKGNYPTVQLRSKATVPSVTFFKTMHQTQM